MIMRTAYVGRTPSSAPDPWSGSSNTPKRNADEGVGRGPGEPPHLAFTYTRVIARFIRTAQAFVASDRWIGTNGPGAARLILGGDDFSGRTAFLYPALQYGLNTVLGIGTRIWNRAQHRSPRTPSAM